MTLVRSFEIPQLSTAWDWNTDLTIHMDGVTVALLRVGFTWHAANYSDPSSWMPVGRRGRHHRHDATINLHGTVVRTNYL